MKLGLKQAVLFGTPDILAPLISALSAKNVPRKLVNLFMGAEESVLVFKSTKEGSQQGTKFPFYNYIDRTGDSGIWAYPLSLNADYVLFVYKKNTVNIYLPEDMRNASKSILQP